MSFGFSVGDFAALGQLAWKIYKACKDAPESFKNISQEVASLHLTLKELEETYSGATLTTDQQSRLETLGDGCRAVLEDLERHLGKYNSLGTKTKRTWDRFGWGSQDIAELRSRLISNTVLLMMFVNTSQVVIQKKLDVFLQDFRDGKHEDSIVSAHTVDSLSTDERQAWRAIRKELEEIGISVTAFDANKEFIVDWLKTAISTGAFEEQKAEDESSSILEEDDSTHSLEDLSHETVLGQPLEDVGHDTGPRPTSVEPQALRPSQGSKSQRRPHSRVAGLIGFLFQHNGSLFKAVQDGDEVKVRKLLENGADVNMKDGIGSRPLHHAVSHNSVVMVRLLLDHGADINAENNRDMTALHMAASLGIETVVQLLLANRANVSVRAEDENITPLHIASKKGHTQTVRLLLENEANVDARAQDEYTALHLASKNGHSETAQLLLESGANAYTGAKDGCTALHIASKKGHSETVKLLLESGANVDSRAEDGHTALHVASRRGRIETARLLIESGANVDIRAETGNTALHFASKNGHRDTARFLLENGANVNESTEERLTALHLASLNGHGEIVRLLLEAGADIKAKSCDLETALHVAAKRGHVGTLYLLLENGANSDEKDIYGRTAQYWQRYTVW